MCIRDSLSDPGVIGCDDVHDDAALEHLGEALLRGPRGRFDGHVWLRSLICSAMVPGATDRGVMPALGRAVARARGPIIAEGSRAPGSGGSGPALGLAQLAVRAIAAFATIGSMDEEAGTLPDIAPR